MENNFIQEIHILDQDEHERAKNLHSKSKKEAAYLFISPRR